MCVFRCTQTKACAESETGQDGKEGHIFFFPGDLVELMKIFYVGVPVCLPIEKSVCVQVWSFCIDCFSLITHLSLFKHVQVPFTIDMDVLHPLARICIGNVPGHGGIDEFFTHNLLLHTW